MSKICAKCEKPVYPLEELKCLDKIWHKLCFKCWECGMTLNMKNYKGFNKFPYCSAHYPQTKHTVVADTPELQRLSQTSKLQSQAKYHEEFEKKIKGSKIQVADDPETQRLKQLSTMVSQVEYKGLKEKFGEMEAKRHINENRNENENASPYTDRTQSHSVAYTGQGKEPRKIGSISDYDPTTSHSSNRQSNSGRPLSKQSQEWQETVPISPAHLAAGGHQGNVSPTKVPSSPTTHQQAGVKATARSSNKKAMGLVCKAMYDYTAQDTDEVTFMENDIIINCDPIDEGWMYGTVQRTGIRGMLPSNYVEKVQ
ncbi:hypothetical protein HELRODRAFT_190341 [Helobdella robusta]|uniref:Uncharacterized protein n=1 Tax=Helobdella robusta TaxID=6412 RepID=T1FRX2_HELRO|nr:hypothetical protein HELRODRAFT_190341 [Helobdella robusta]ESO09962.1 hypothetical protein HELRODRAFT_190341 [Helobdella robusta]